MWCLRCQEELMKVENWPEKFKTFPETATQRANDGTLIFRGLRVAMGIHTGEPICNPDPMTGRMDYFGPMVNRSARVMQAASGGQIIVSGPVWRHIQNNLEEFGMPNIETLGEAQLKGLDTPELLTEVLPSSLKLRSKEFSPIPLTTEEDKDENVTSVVSDLQNKAASLNGRLDAMRATLEITNRALKAIEPRLVEAADHLDSDPVTQLREITQVQETLGSRVGDLKTRNTGVMDNLSNVILEANELQEKADTAYQEKGRIQRHLVILKESYEQAKAHVAIFEARIASLQSKIGSKDVSELSTSGLTDKMTNLETDIENLRKQQRDTQNQMNELMLKASSSEDNSALKEIIEKNAEMEKILSDINDKLVKKSGELAKAKEMEIQMDQELQEVAKLEKVLFDDKEIQFIQEKIEEQTQLLQQLKVQAKRKQTLLRKTFRITHPALKVVQKLEKDESAIDLLTEKKVTQLSQRERVARDKDDKGKEEEEGKSEEYASDGEGGDNEGENDDVPKGLVNLISESVVIIASDGNTKATLGVVEYSKENKCFVVASHDVNEILSAPGAHLLSVFTYELEGSHQETEFTFSLKNLELDRSISSRSASSSDPSLSLSKKSISTEAERITTTILPTSPSLWVIDKKLIFGERVDDQIIKLRCGNKKGKKYVALEFRVIVVNMVE